MKHTRNFKTSDEDISEIIFCVKCLKIPEILNFQNTGNFKIAKFMVLSQNDQKHEFLVFLTQQPAQMVRLKIHHI